VNGKVLDYGMRNIVGVQINAIDYEAAVARISAAAEKHERLTVSALAIHGVMRGELDPSHQFRTLAGAGTAVWTR
jgi:N-acetylglucosaminyldiphosphoundecaprenol N-acetyl-beta-D-mannosaminyltransferase